ncbi:hypothetical protein BDR07DRAFT_1487320 [Suillus spraguei]|nr:hypothetical protein BDR07DRAFT_1487320 [Suillus spraguei]
MKQTVAQKALSKARRKKHHDEYAEALTAARDIVKEQAALLYEKFGRHSINYYFEEIMQCSQLTGQCKVTMWNAFIKKEVEHHNSVLPAGKRRHKACKLMPQICARWQEMDENQHTAETEVVIESIKECHEMKELSSHSVMLSTLVDANKTLEKVDRELTTLHSCTGIEFILLAVQGDTEHWNQPHIFNTAHAAEFFDSCLKTSLGTLAFHFEGYCVAGLAKTHVEEVLDLKKNLSEMILQKLHEWIVSLQSSYQPSMLFFSRARDSSITQADAEFRDWETSRFNAAMAQMSDNTNIDPSTNDMALLPGSQSSDLATEANGSSTLTPIPVDQPPPPAPQHRKWLAAELTGIFSASGGGVVVQKKACKERSDRDKKHGPRKGTRVATPTVASASPPNSAVSAESVDSAPGTVSLASPSS